MRYRLLMDPERGDLKSIDTVVPADQNGHVYTFWTYDTKEVFYDSAAKSCGDKGMRDQSIASSSVLLNTADLNNLTACENSVCKRIDFLSKVRITFSLRGRLKMRKFNS